MSCRCCFAQWLHHDTVRPFTRVVATAAQTSWYVGVCTGSAQYILLNLYRQKFGAFLISGGELQRCVCWRGVCVGGWRPGRKGLSEWVINFSVILPDMIPTSFPLVWCRSMRKLVMRHRNKERGRVSLQLFLISLFWLLIWLPYSKAWKPGHNSSMGSVNGTAFLVDVFFHLNSSPQSSPWISLTVALRY